MSDIKVVEEGASEPVEVPDDALSPDHSWSVRGEDAVKAWERIFVEPWTGDYGDCVRYVAWRTGMSDGDAMQWVKAQDTFLMANRIEALTKAYNMNADAVREARISQQEHTDRYYELQARHIEALERSLPYMEQQAEEMEQDDTWKGDPE